MSKRALGFLNKIPPVNAWDGLVSLYKLDETSGTTAYDSYGTANLTNTAITINQSGKLGTSYVCTAQNQYLTKSGVAQINTDFTINAWCYRTGATAAGNKSIAEQGTYANGFGIWINNSNYIGYLLNTNYIYSTTTLPLNTWAMVTFTCQSGVVKMYFNGVEISIAQPIAPYISNTATTRRLFTRTDYSSENFFGRIDNCSFFNVALTQEQVTAHYNSGNGITL